MLHPHNKNISSLFIIHEHVFAIKVDGINFFRILCGSKNNEIDVTKALTTCSGKSYNTDIDETLMITSASSEWAQGPESEKNYENRSSSSQW